MTTAVATWVGAPKRDRRSSRSGDTSLTDANGTGHDGRALADLSRRTRAQARQYSVDAQVGRLGLPHPRWFDTEPVCGYNRLMQRGNRREFVSLDGMD